MAEERPPALAGPGAGTRHWTRQAYSPPSSSVACAAGGVGAVAAARSGGLIDLFPDAILVAAQPATSGWPTPPPAAVPHRPANLVGRSLVSLAPEWSRAAYAEVIEDFASSGKGQFLGGPPRAGHRLRCDGTEVDVEVTMGAIEQLDEPRPGLVVAVRDVR